MPPELDFQEASTSDACTASTSTLLSIQMNSGLTEKLLQHSGAKPPTMESHLQDSTLSVATQTSWPQLRDWKYIEWLTHRSFIHLNSPNFLSIESHLWIDPATFLLPHSGQNVNYKWLCFHNERHIVHTRIKILTWPRWKRVSSPPGKETKSPSQACDLTGVRTCTSWSFKKNLCYYGVGSPTTDVGFSHLHNEITKKTFAGMRQNVYVNDFWQEISWKQKHKLYIFKALWRYKGAL